MSAVTPQDALSVTAGCLELLRDLPGGERRRVLTALTAVVDLTEDSRFVVGVDPASGPDRTAFTVLRRSYTQEPTLSSPHFACAPEDVPERAKRGPKTAPGKGIPRAERQAEAARKREIVLQAVRAAGAGGTTPLMVAEQAGVDRATAGWHLRRLLKTGAVDASGTGNTIRYVAKELPAEPAPKGPSPAERLQAACLKAARTEGGTTATMISKATGIERVMAQNCLKRLLNTGLVYKTGNVRSARYHATSPGLSPASSTSR